MPGAGIVEGGTALQTKGQFAANHTDSPDQFVRYSTGPGEVSLIPTATYTITKIKRGERRRKPLAPFTTSTLQQDASRKLGFTFRSPHEAP